MEFRQVFLKRKWDGFSTNKFWKLGMIILCLLPIKSVIAQNCSVNAGVDFTICANSTLTLGGGKAGLFQGAGNVTWTQISGPSAVITDPTNLNTTVTSLVGGNVYKFRLSAICLDGSLVYDDVNVTVSAISISNAGPDQTVCPGVSISNLAADALKSGETGVWTVQGTNNGITVLSSTSPTSAITASSTQAGNTTLRWTVTNGACSSYDDVVITDRGGASVVTAGADRSANGCYVSTQTASSSGTSFGGNAGGQSGLWSVISGPNIPGISSPTSNSTNFTNLIQGTYTFRWTVSGVCVNGYDDMQVVVAAPNGGVTTATINSPATTSGNTTTGTSTYCDGRTSVTLIGSSTTKANETVAWTVSGSAGGSLSSTNTPSTNVTGLIPGATYANSNVYTYKISNANGCTSQATRTINWTAPPAFNITSTSPMILSCGITSASIVYTASGSGTLQWMIVSGPTTPTYPSIPTGWTNVGASPYTISGFTKPGTYQLRFQKSAGSGSSCNTIFQDFTIVVAQTPTASNAGTAQVLACNVFNTNLVGNVPTVGTGTWTQVSGPNTAAISNAAANNTPISGLISGKYVFRWLINSGNSCPNTQDDVSVIVSDPTPTASAAGSDLTICNSTPFILTGNTPKVNETGTWTVSPSASVTISDIHSPNATATGMASNTTYTFTWTISNACGSSSDDIQITTNAVAGPIPSLAGTDQCLPSGTSSINLAGNNPVAGTGTWTKITGGGATISNPSLYNSTVTGLSDGSYTFEWSIQRNSCTITRDTVTITISGSTTTANAGTDQNVCGNSATMAGNNPTAGTGHWTQVSGVGGALITDPTLYNTTITGLQPGAYIFRWTISNQACGSNYDDVQLNVSTPPTTAAAGPDQSICSGTTVTMAGNVISTGTGSWSVVGGPNTPTITTVSSPTTTITGLTNGTYTFRWKSYNGAYCPASTDDVVVDVTQAVTSASLGGNQNLCGVTSATLTGNASTSGTWTQDAGPNTASLTVISANATVASGLIAGAYTFRYTYNNPTACTNTATITVTVSAMATQADAGPDQTVCDVTSITMAANTASVGTGAWSRVSGPNTPNIVSSSTPTTNIGTTTALTNGTYVYRWTITNGACSTSDDMIITRSSSSMIANAGPDQNSVCGTTTTLAGNSPSPGTGTWSQVSGPNTANITSPVLPGTTVTGMIPGTYIFRWSITNGICSPSTDDVSVTMFANPTTANAGPDQNICGLSTASLAANTVLVGTGSWSQISGPNTAIFDNTTNPTASLSGLTTGTYVFQWTTTNGSCTSSDNVSISVIASPTTALAGTDQSICLFAPLNLSGNTPVTGTGTWIQISGSAAIIQTPGSPTSAITGVSAGSYGFRWTITNSPCPASTDDVLITVNNLPSQAIAGADQSLCNVTSATMAATAPTVGTGTWMLVSGPNVPSFTNANLYNTTITGMIPGTYVFDWTIANGPCTSSDQVQVIIAAPPTTANAGIDQNICGTTFTTFEGNPPTSGSGTWSRISGPNTPTITDVNSPVSTVTGLITGTYVFRWTISNGSCTTSFDNVQITVTTGSVTVANAGTDQTDASLCGLTSTNLAGNNPVTGTGAWSIRTGSGGTITNNNLNNSSFSGNAGSSYILRWTITNGTCSSYDDVTVTFPKNPSTANAGVDQTSSAMCGLTSTTLAANTPADGTGSWSVISGTGGSFGNTSSPVSTFTGNAEQSYILKWSISNNPCTTSEDQVIVEFKERPASPAALNSQTFCKGDAPDLTNFAITGTNINWYAASSNGTALSTSTPLVHGTTYYATQTINSCESATRTAVQTNLTSCIGPVLGDVTVSLNENSTNGALVYNESDINTSSDFDGDNDPIVYSITAGNESGAFVIDPSTGVVSVADASKIDFETVHSYILTIHTTDGLNTDDGLLTILISNLNDNNPVSVDDTYSVNEGQTLTIPGPGVLSNDSDADNDPLTAVLISSPAYGSITLKPDGSFTYQNNGSEHTVDQFTYKANDGLHESNEATVIINIVPVNDAPVAVDDNYTVNEGDFLQINVPGVLTNDSDPENDALQASLVSGPSHGVLLLNADGSFSYQHDGSETNSDQFTYRVKDNNIDSNTATVSISILPVNDAPTAVSDDFTVQEGKTLSVIATGVLSNDHDPDGDAITSILVNSVNHGTLTLLSDGSFVYQHDGSETTSDVFSYKVNDGKVDGNTVNVTIHINPVNDAPVAVDDNYSVSEGKTLTIPAASGVISNDHDAENDPLTTVLLSLPSHGSVTLNGDGSFSYVNDGSLNATDQFTYKVNDGLEDSNIATVTIQIVSTNHAPIATDDHYTLTEGATLTMASPGILNNDMDADGNTLTAVLVTSAQHGTITLHTDGSFVYTHDGSETVSDQFTYKVNDGTTDSNVATVYLQITKVNDAPVTVSDAYTVNEGETLTMSAPGVLANDSDPDGDNIQAVLVNGPAHGTLKLNSDGSFSYQHDGSETHTDQFTYKTNDGLTDGNTVQVILTIVPVNDAPVAADDAYSVKQGATLQINISGVLTNDTDAEGDALSVILAGSTTHGTLTLNQDGSFTYVHDGGASLTDEFTYKVTDGKIIGNTATVVITIEPLTTNHVPKLVDDMDTTLMNKPITLTVLSNDSGLEDGGLSMLVTVPQNGNVVQNGDYTILYTPKQGFTGIDQFTYQICDGNGDCSRATVKIVVESSIFIPEGFSPDGDGINDYFEIPELSKFNQVGIVIFNRWGNIVFEDSNYKNNWNGKSNKNITGSEELPVGTYFYILTIQDTGKKISGYIYLNK